MVFLSPGQFGHQPAQSRGVVSTEGIQISLQGQSLKTGLKQIQLDMIERREKLSMKVSEQERMG